MPLKESCAECINLEFRVASLQLQHDDPRVFIQSQWSFHQRVFVVYRIFVAGGFLAWLTADVYKETRSFFKDHTYTYLIYATNWSFLLLTFTALYMAICTFVYSIRFKDCLDRETFDSMPLALKVQWVLQNLSYNSAIVVTITYWSYVAVLDSDELLLTTSSKVKHTLNSIYVILDIFMTGGPIRVLHFIYTAILGGIYSLFNAIYFLNDGTILEGRHYAYNVLDWGKPSRAAITCILCVVLCIFSQVILYELYCIRHFIYTKLYFGSDNSSKPDAELERIIGETETPAYQTIACNNAQCIDGQEHEDAYVP